MLLCDTSVLVAYLRGDERTRTLLRSHASDGQLLVPTLVGWELWKGARSRERRLALDSLLGGCRSLPLTMAIARTAGDLHRTLQDQGTTKAAFDLLIAAHAIDHGCPLATLDGDFADIPGLQTTRP